MFKPINQASTIHSDMVAKPEYYQKDNQAVFSRNWIYLCSLSELKSVQEFKTIISGKPIIAFMNAQDEIAVFYDVCKHRSGPLKVEKNRIICGYHGWTYDFDGSLKGTPEMAGIENFDKTCFALSPIQFQTWNGLIFICFEGSTTLSDHLLGIKERIHPIDISTFQFHHKEVYKINCNWKVYVENYLEGYHLPHVHPGLSNLLDYRQYRTELFPFYSLQFSPFKAGENIYSGDSDGEAFYYFIYPNLMLNILPNRLQINAVRPINAHQCEVVFDYLYDKSIVGHTKFIEDDLSYSDEIQQEDIDICEKVQVRLESGVYTQGRYSPVRETGLYHFHQLYLKDIG